MVKCNKTRAFVLSGGIWLIVGVLLIYKGFFLILEELRLLLNGIFPPFSLVLFLSKFSGSLERSALLLFSLALIVGFLKGHFALKKAAGKVIQRVAFQDASLSWSSLYPKAYFILLGSMLLLGMALKHLPLGVRGGIDFAIGIALVYGSFFYFKELFIRKNV